MILSYESAAIYFGGKPKLCSTPDTSLFPYPITGCSTFLKSVYLRIHLVQFSLFSCYWYTCFVYYICVVCAFYTFFISPLILCFVIQSIKRTDLLTSNQSFNGKLPVKVTPALTLVACIWKVAGSNVGWHTQILAHFVLFLSLLRQILG
jgi:hypothetical protein